MTVGERIKIKRTERNMSQDELARKMGYKDRSSISKIEKDCDENITLDSIQKIAEILCCSPLYLMGWDDNSDNSPKEREKHFVDLYLSLNEGDQELIDNMLETLSSRQ